MKSSRPSRFVAALIVLFSVLFMQFAVAAYVCPGHGTGQVNEPVVMSIGSDISHMEECQGMDLEQPGLCQAHDHAGSQSLDKPQLPQVQPFIPAAMALTLAPLDVEYRPLVRQSEDLRLSRPTAPPLSIQHCCFRI
jgi:hypothetical protein